MDNVGNSHLPGNDVNKPIPFDDGLPPSSPGGASKGPAPGVSRAPLNLGAGPATPVPSKPAPKTVTSSPVSRKPDPHAASADRITGLKTFFTKLHPGAMEFLDDLVNTWLKENPSVVVKRTDVTTGDVQAKKTEPNIIVCIWY